MLEQFIQLREQYPPGAEIEIITDGHPERAVVVEHRLTADAAYLVMLDGSRIDSRRVTEIVKKA